MLFNLWQQHGRITTLSKHFSVKIQHAKTLLTRNFIVFGFQYVFEQGSPK